MPKSRLYALQSKMIWVKHRLATMESAEIMSRFADISRHLTLRLNGLEPRSRTRSAASMHQIGAPRLSRQLQASELMLPQRVLDHAKRWQKHEGSLFALDRIPLGGEINWHRDYA